MTSSSVIAKVVVLGLVLGCLIAVVQATESKENHKEKVEALVRSWEKALSGKPVNCRRYVDLFVEDGYLHTPAASSDGSLAPIHGQIFIFKSCEEGRYFSKFSQVETFATGRIVISGNTVSFSRTSLLITDDTGCRMTMHGYTALNFDDDYKILHAYDFWSHEELDDQWSKCHFPVKKALSEAQPEPVL